MAVIHIITGLNDGGAEAVLYRLCTADNKNTHLVISLMDEGKYGPLLKQAGIHVECIYMSPGRITFNGLVKLWQLLRQHQPDIVQTWMYHADLIGGLIARLAGTRAVCWGIRHSNLDPNKSNRSTIWIAHVCAVLSYHIPVQIICCSHKAAQVHQALGYTPEKLVIIPNGYDLKRFQQNEAARIATRTEWNVDANMPVLGMVARFNPQKDHANLIAALGLLHAKGQGFRCVLVGTGMESSNRSLQKMLGDANVEDLVTMVGPQEHIPSIMNALDIHVLSSAGGEAFPNVLAEAMACGTPCVTTDVGDAALIVGDHGWVVPPQNPEALAGAICEALSEFQNSSVWRLRQNACRKRIEEKFRLDKMVEAYRAIWTQSIHG